MSGPYATEAPFAWTFDLRGKAVATDDDGGITVSGIASDYLPDRDDEYVAREGLAAGLRSYMETNPVILWQHDFSKPVGRCVSAYLADDGLHITARLEPATHPASWQADLLAKVRAGVVKSFSIGGRFHRKAPGRVDHVDLVEISVCSSGVNPRALFRVEPLATTTRKAFAANPGDDWKAIRNVLSNLKQEAEMWNHRRPEPEARATMLYATDDPEGEYRRRQVQERAKAAEAARQALTHDGPNETEQVQFHDFWGIEAAKDQAADNVLAEQVYELSADQVAALHGAAAQPVEPSFHGSFLDLKQREAEAGERRRKLLAPFDDLIARKEAAR